MKKLCDDWACPAKVSCRHHFGRSRQYAAMKDGGYEIEARTRALVADSCSDYECDKPRRWLMPHEGAVTHYPGGTA